jgi:hypothetical protein
MIFVFFIFHCLKKIKKNNFIFYTHSFHFKTSISHTSKMARSRLYQLCSLAEQDFTPEGFPPPLLAELLAKMIETGMFQGLKASEIQVADFKEQNKVITLAVQCLVYCPINKARGYQVMVLDVEQDGFMSSHVLGAGYCDADRPSRTENK